MATMFTLAAASQSDYFPHTHRSKRTLTNNFLQAGNISSALCSSILGTFAATDIGLFCMLKTCSSHMMLLFV